MRCRRALFVLALALAAASAQAGSPPEFPVSRPCGQSDVKRLWRLIGLWEEPEGTYTREKRAFSQQYLAFLDDQNYVSYYSSKRPKDQAQLLGWLQSARTRGGTSLRYLLTEKGALYLYRDKRVMVSATCNIAIERKGRFKRGSMWLYQSINAPDIKLVRLYEPIPLDPPPMPYTPNAPLAQPEE